MTADETSESLQDRLDDLWTQHLELLNEYTAAQAHLKKHLASGYFSLTQANFKSSGRRFGKDFYDDRAVASTRAELDDKLQVKILKSQEDANQHGKQGADDLGDDAASGKGAINDRVGKLPRPSPEMENISDDKIKTEPDSADTASRTMSSNDPIRWFGILVPPPLRSAQASFCSAVSDETGVAKAVNAARGLREVEVEIRKLRKTIKKSDRIMES